MKNSKPKPVFGKPRVHYYSFKLPDGKFVGRESFHSPLTPQPPGRAITYSADGIAARRAEILALFPEAKITPTPQWNPESAEYETPIDVPSLN